MCSRQGRNLRPEAGDERRRHRRRGRESHEDGTFDVVIVNFANADMVGHSGKIEPTIKAVETVDSCLARIEKSCPRQRRSYPDHADHAMPK